MVAQQLLGKRMVSKIGSKLTAGIVVEAEAVLPKRIRLATVGECLTRRTLKTLLLKMSRKFPFSGNPHVMQHDLLLSGEWPDIGCYQCMWE